jgi:hypothetical protein
MESDCTGGQWHSLPGAKNLPGAQHRDEQVHDHIEDVAMGAERTKTHSIANVAPPSKDLFNLPHGKFGHN